MENTTASQNKLCGQWTREEDDFIREHWETMSDADMARALNRGANATACRRRSLNLSGKRNWTPDEVEYLRNNWGYKSIPAIALTLNRSAYGIKMKAQKLKLGAVLDSGDYVTLNQLLQTVFNTEQSYSYRWKTLVLDRGLPVHTKKVDRCSWRVVFLHEFWPWAEKHRSFLDFSQLEPLALGKEPAWVGEQRRIDILTANRIRRFAPWTPEEDQRLVFMLKRHMYSWSEIARDLRRSDGAVQARCITLGVPDRPLRDDPHSPWTPEHTELLADMIRGGYSPVLIGDACGGRSEKAVRGHCYSVYQTEDMDKIRVMLGDGKWGDGAPEPKVWPNRRKTAVKRGVSKLCGLLMLQKEKTESLVAPWDQYWQREVCQHWDPTHGCTLASSCDSCTAFQRIKPQYCEKCGTEFLDRQAQPLCPRCRDELKNSPPRRPKRRKV